MTIIGGGLAGCEAAWRLGRAGINARLFEMRPGKNTPAHKTTLLAELVCSNSLKSTSLTNGPGLLKAEMEILDSLVMSAARKCSVPAGGALAVDREKFADRITRKIESLPSVELVREEIEDIPEAGIVIIASGPLTSESLADSIKRLTGEQDLFFYDAIAPIVTADSIDMSVCFRASRYDKGGADYINCPMSREEYERFVEAVMEGRKTPLRDFEESRFFDGCLPLEVMAERGRDTLAHGPMKPVGLVDPRTGQRPHAVVQLRQDDEEARLYNMVGFQTRLARPEQERIFRMIPGLENAEFARLGTIHRNTYINSPRVLAKNMSLEKEPRIFFAGQITGVEGYLESSAIGIMAGISVERAVSGKQPAIPPPTTMIGALMAYITDRGRNDFQPMNANFGILPSIAVRARKLERKTMIAEMAVRDMRGFVDGLFSHDGNNSQCL